ncbi:hypothetical protein VW29_10815 [Devosia limi DSM 17137]|uniref:Transposase domain n=1 Tax=Devosia limi DSM 17137 TaxID=1121477 RepID=A0A0F5LQ18_9HYPH|nr:hypothetical protein VW29_10815 [Devosia limi DSM 17137]SHF60126.1 Transposase domain [Devosia limi DSM 17137]
MGRLSRLPIDLWRVSCPPAWKDYVGPDEPVRIIDAFVGELDLAELTFAHVQPASTGRPGYGPGTMLKHLRLWILHQLTSSRKLEREAGRNIELMWLTGKLITDFKTIANSGDGSMKQVGAMQRRLDATPEAMAAGRFTVEHVFGTNRGSLAARYVAANARFGELFR